jgi:hypothetical protein
LERVRQLVRLERPKLFSGKWTLHRDIAPADTALSVQEFLAKERKSRGPGTSPQILLRVTSSSFLPRSSMSRDHISKSWKRCRRLSGRSKQLVEEWHLEIHRQL